MAMEWSWSRVGVEFDSYWVKLEWNCSSLEWSWSGVGVDVFSQLRFNSGRFPGLPEEKRKNSIVKTDVHVYDT